MMTEQLDILTCINFNSSMQSQPHVTCSSTAIYPDAKRVIWMRSGNSELAPANWYSR